METQFRFDWGQTVRIKDNAPPPLRGREEVAVVGMREIRNRTEAKASGHPVGTRLYLLEYSDGTSIEAPEDVIDGV